MNDISGLDHIPLTGDLIALIFVCLLFYLALVSVKVQYLLKQNGTDS